MAGKLQYFVIYKPYKILSQFSDEAPNKGLGSIFKLPKNVYPVGRLDLDSEGLLLLTNDKSLNQRLLHPKHAHKRTYHVEVEGIPHRSALEELRSGVVINNGGKMYPTLACEANLLHDYTLNERIPPVNRLKHTTTSWLSISLTEGKNRQVRKMTAKIGHPTLRLLRVAIEDLRLGNMEAGDISMLSKNTVYQKLKLL